LTNVTIPNSVTNIGANSFRGCGRLTSIIIPNGVISIGIDAFADCTNLARVSIGDHVASLRSSAFWDCPSLTNLTIGSGVRDIGDLAFADCTSLAEVAIPDNVTNIFDNVFSNCSSLSNATVGSNVWFLGEKMFAGCTNLTGLFFRGNAPLADDTALSGDNRAIVYYLPGTRGWTNTYAGRPARLWNPVARAPAVGNHQFSFDITGTTNIPVVIEAGTDLSGGVWVPLQTGTLTNGLLTFSDTAWTNSPVRFYRLRWP
jgi:hypothetical protein